MKKRKLNYRIHDPNPPALSAEVVLKIMIDVNRAKVEAAIQRELDKRAGDNSQIAVNSI